MYLYRQFYYIPYSPYYRLLFSKNIKEKREKRKKKKKGRRRLCVNARVPHSNILTSKNGAINIEVLRKRKSESIWYASPIPFIKIVQIPNTILAKQIQQFITRIIRHAQVRSILDTLD